MTTVDESQAAPPVTQVGDEHGEPELAEPRSRRRRLVWAASGVTLAAVLGVGVGLWATGTSDETESAASAPRATATVERGTITATDSWDGTLGQGSPFTVTGGRQGTVTRIAEQGATVGRGDELFRVDEQPVILLIGAVPMYRDLGPGDVGADVAQLEGNLAELGYAGFTVDDQYTSSTATAVRAWQASGGAAQSGTVGRGAVVFAPAGGEVATVRAAVGDVVAPGAPVLDVTGTEQVVDVDAEIDDLDRFEVGSAVTVVLPGGDEVAGRVSSTEVVEVAPAGMSGEAADAAPVGRVEVTLDENAPDELVGAPVEVIVAVDERADVLVVPVNALLALAGGGYGLEVVADDGTTSLVPVETGLFAGGKVEVESADIDEGTVVGAAGR